MRTRSRLMPAGGKGRGKGVLTAQVRKHRNWSHTLSNYRQDWQHCSTAQTSGDLRFAPVSLGMGLGSHRNHPTHLWALVPFPAHRVRVQRSGCLHVVGLRSCSHSAVCILLKLALLPARTRDRPGVRLNGDVTLNGRGLDHSGCLPKPPSWAQKISRAQLPVLGSSSQLVSMCLEPTTLVGCQHHKRGGATRRVPASGHNGEGQAGLDKCDRRPRPACGEGTPRKGRLNSSPCSCCGASVKLPEGSRTWAPFS